MSRTSPEPSSGEPLSRFDCTYSCCHMYLKTSNSSSTLSIAAAVSGPISFWPSLALGRTTDGTVSSESVAHISLPTKTVRSSVSSIPSSDSDGRRGRRRRRNSSYGLIAERTVPFVACAASPPPPRSVFFSSVIKVEKSSG